jgi:hypothetical protein
MTKKGFLPCHSEGAKTRHAHRICGEGGAERPKNLSKKNLHLGKFDASKNFGVY